MRCTTACSMVCLWRYKHWCLTPPAPYCVPKHACILSSSPLAEAATFDFCGQVVPQSVLHNKALQLIQEQDSVQSLTWSALNDGACVCCRWCLSCRSGQHLVSFLQAASHASTPVSLATHQSLWSQLLALHLHVLQHLLPAAQVQHNGGA